MSRNVNVKKIRPILNLVNANNKPLELFQNETIRPILKFQHDLTYDLLKTYESFKLNQHSNISREQFEKLLVKFMQTNLVFKNQLIGTIVALFTSVEFEYYKSHRKEINRRIIQMQLKRYLDTIYSS